MKLRRFGLLLAWLLVLAVPVQGFASVSAAMCMTQADHHDSGDAHSHDPEHGDPAPSSHACAACAGCCAGAAISYFLPPIAAVQHATPADAAAVPSHPGVAPYRLDRPPP